MTFSLRDFCLPILLLILACGCAGEDSAPEEPGPAPVKQEEGDPKPDSSAPELIPPEVEKKQSQLGSSGSAAES